MELNKYGGVFSFDKKKTEEYYKNRTELCDCENCKYFYSHIKGLFPKLDEFLSDFGIDIERPDEVWAVETADKFLVIEAGYTVCGNIIGNVPSDFKKNLLSDFLIDDKQKIKIVYAHGFCFPNSQQGDYFSISVRDFSIPYQNG